MWVCMAVNINAEFDDVDNRNRRDLIDDVCRVIRDVDGLDVDNQSVDAGRLSDDQGQYARFPVEAYDWSENKSVVNAVEEALEQNVSSFNTVEEL